MSNFPIADFVSSLNCAAKRRLKAIDIPFSQLFLNILIILYKNGVINGFKVIKHKFIRVFFKFFQNKNVYYSLKLVSKPSRRIVWSLNQLSFSYNMHNFGGFYIISTNKDY